MPIIALTDNAGLSADIQLRQDSPLAIAGLTKIVCSAAGLAACIARPVGETGVRSISFGGTFAAPSKLIADAASLGVSGSASGALTVFTSADGNLFGADPFAPAIPIAADECWVECEIDASLNTALGGSVDGFGVGVSAGVSLSLASYTRVPASVTLADALGAALGAYGVACTAGAIRSQPAGTVRAVDLSGSLTFSGSYSLPINVNALAFANLPFNYKIKVEPAMAVSVSGRISLTGDFLVRSSKMSDTEVVLGVYKKKGTTLAASLSAGAGIQTDLGSTDLLATVLAAVMPKVDPAKSGIDPATAATLQGVLNASIDRSLSIAVNVACSASFTHEAAVIYSIDLAAGDPAATDAAIASALGGDWTALGALPNARMLRNIVVNTSEHKHKLAISLLGIYNATSVEDFVQSCTILHDENGHIVITDKASASRIAAVSAPLMVDKLRSALAEAFLATVTYTAGAGAKLQSNLSVSQTYFEYAGQMSRQKMQDAILLSRALGQDRSLDPGSSFQHVRIAASVRYDNAAAMRLFFADPAAHTPRSHDGLARIGRTAMLDLIDPGDPAAGVRRRILADDGAWKAMDDNGNRAGFQFLPQLSGLGDTDREAVGTDWTDVTWWADSIAKVAPALSAMLDAAERSQAADPTTDADFMHQRDRLAAKLAGVTGKTHAAFVGGWGLAVMFALSGRTAQASVEIDPAAAPSS